MKKLKIFKVLDLFASILFLFIFFNKHRITDNYEYGFGQLIEILFLSPIFIFLIISIVMAILSLIRKQSYIYSIIGQIFKIISFLSYICICSLLLNVTILIDYIFITPVFGVVSIIILYSIYYKMKKCNNEEVELNSNRIDIK